MVHSTSRASVCGECVRSQRLFVTEDTFFRHQDCFILKERQSVH